MEDNVYKLLGEAQNILSRFRPYGYDYGGQGFLTIERALSYPETEQLSYRDFHDRYLRQDIAYRIIKAPVGVTWKDTPDVRDDNQDSVFSKVFDEIAEKVQLYKNLTTVDLLSRIGNYALLFLGFEDGMDTSVPIKPGSRLVYVKPIAQPVIEIVSYDLNPESSRYGAPFMYSIAIITNGETATKYVHYTRVLHIAQNTLDDPYVGIPALLPVYNRLLGLEKIAGGSPEMYWRGARPGYAASSSGGVMATKEQIDNFKETISDFVNNMNRWLYSEDLKIQSLAPQVVSPKEHYEVQLQLISAATRIPLRILTGSERGELASDQDERGWLSYIEERRDEIGRKIILKPLIDRFIEYKIIPPPTGMYYIYWKPLVVISEKDKADIADVYASALKKYDESMTAGDIIPPEIFIKYFLRLEDSIIREIEEINAKKIADDDITDDIIQATTEETSNEVNAE